MDFPEHPFWDFSIDLYRKEGVAPACLALQERHQIDVNFLLFCCWLGRAGFGAQGDGRVGRMHDSVAPWHHEVVRGLRTVRKRLKQGFAGAPDELRLALRKRLAALEIDAEHVEQLTLAAALGDLAPESADPEGGDPDSGAADATANFASYFAVRGIEPGEDDQKELAIILAAAFPDVETTRIGGLCRALEKSP